MWSLHTKVSLYSIFYSIFYSIISFYVFYKQHIIKKTTLTCQIIVRQNFFLGGGKSTYTTLLGLLISEIFPSKPDFHLNKWEKDPSYIALLLRTTCLLISEKSAIYTIKWSYMIIWQARVVGRFWILYIHCLIFWE